MKVLMISKGKRIVMDVDAQTEDEAREKAMAKASKPYEIIAIMEDGEFEMMQELMGQPGSSRSKTGGLPGLGGKLEA